MTIIASSLLSDPEALAARYPDGDVAEDVPSLQGEHVRLDEVDCGDPETQNSTARGGLSSGGESGTTFNSGVS